MSPPFSFRFEPVADQKSYVDRANGLRLRLYQWPEYSYAIGVQPLSGGQAEAWPVDQRVYFQFYVDEKYEGGIRTLWVGGVRAYVPFERDYPGRTEELLETVVPLLSAVFEHVTRPVC